MEDNRTNSSKTAIEDNYQKNKNNPGPPPEAFKEEDDKGSGKFIFWVLLAIIVILTIAWIIF
ncbi:hypothetical protein H8S90_22445 [Olivibacter sp. SDN3]|uniref:hypothetical protein n=1 Tax=Olivibacter sp. SDN3 TaxID=2764720 RepID=UPI001651584E|nr:hypothetical protein [Olivibacter sp. SDN3]QNL49456.1 hypothetical protein H8S90_22445 [Olivibacter sp. SDN3]